MELVQEVRDAVHATANPEYEAWVGHAGGLDLAPLRIPGLALDAWVVSPRAARPPVGVLVVRLADGLVVTTGDARAAGRVLAAATVADKDLPTVLFDLLRSRARPMELVTTPAEAALLPGAATPRVSHRGDAIDVALCVSRGVLAPEAWTLTWPRGGDTGRAGDLEWTRTPLVSTAGGTP